MAQQSLIPDEHLTRTLGDLAADYSPMEVVEAVRHLWHDLLDPSSTPARLTDRQTSQDAAARHSTHDVTQFKRGSIAHKVLSAFVWRGYPCTALHAARLASNSDDTVRTETARKRVAELERAGYIVQAGVTTEEGSDRTLYRPTDAGVTAVAHADSTGWARPKGQA